jgi:uncharacterized protein YecE (DUF72 family)
MIRFAPAGWDYPDWYGKVYPLPKPKGFDPLVYLSQFVSAIEINSTFYRPPSPKTCASWRDRVAGRPDFRFTAKLSQRFTHERGTAWTTAEVDEVRAGFDVLQQAGLLGAVLLQFPWSYRNSDENREWLRDLLTAFQMYRLVVEVRHASWNAGDVYAELAERGVGIANIDQPLFRNSLKPAALATSSVGYVRVHGRNFLDWFRPPQRAEPEAAPDRKAVLASRDAKFNYLYSLDELTPWVERIKTVAALPPVADLFVVTNNHYEGQAVANLIQLQALVTGVPVIAPPPITVSYADAVRGFVRTDAPAPAANPPPGNQGSAPVTTPGAPPGR